jgi:hypothetical protein
MIDDGGVRKIQVWIANLPETAAEHIQQSLRQHLDSQTPGYVQGNVESLPAVSTEMDVFILGADKVYLPPDICIDLFSEFPDLKIIVLVGDEATTYWIRPRR